MYKVSYKVHCITIYGLHKTNISLQSLLQISLHALVKKKKKAISYFKIHLDALTLPGTQTTQSQSFPSFGNLHLGPRSDTNDQLGRFLTPQTA